MSAAGAPVGPVVSSGHLASGGLPALSEMEFGMILMGHAFHRWMVRCMAAAGVKGLSPLAILVLHNVNHRGTAKTLADISLVLNVEDTHLVNYAVKKLASLKLVKTGRAGKEKVISATEAGQHLCLRYREIRESLLVSPVVGTGVDPKRLSEIAAMLRALSGTYDQAARAAASL